MDFVRLLGTCIASVILSQCLLYIQNCFLSACISSSLSDVVFMIDISANISKEIFNRQLDVIQEILKEVQSSSDLTLSPNNLQIAGIVYSSGIRFILYLNQTHDISILPQYFILNQENVVNERNVKKVMDFLQKNVFHADHGARSNSRNIVIFLVTDLVDPNLFAPMKQTGTTIIAIGINQNLDDDVVNRIATSPSHAYFTDDGIDADMARLVIRPVTYTKCSDRIHL